MSHATAAQPHQDCRRPLHVHEVYMLCHPETTGAFHCRVYVRPAGVGSNDFPPTPGMQGTVYSGRPEEDPLPGGVGGCNPPPKPSAASRLRAGFVQECQVTRLGRATRPLTETGHMYVQLCTLCCAPVRLTNEGRSASYFKVLTNPNEEATSSPQHH